MDPYLRSFGAFLTALLTSFLLAPPFVEWLRRRQIEQVFRGVGEVRQLATLHASKAHTPTMGGWLIFFSTILAMVLWMPKGPYFWLICAVYAAFTLVGFCDDLLKLNRRSSAGLRGWRKLACQAAVCFMVLLGLRYGDPSIYDSLRAIYLPRLANPILAGLPFIVLLLFFFCVVAGTSNAVNLTDGVDGLATGCGMMATLSLFFLSICVGQAPLAARLRLPWVESGGELAVVCAALLGSLAVFFWHNAKPAAVFMGDTGAIGLGAVLGLIGFLLLSPFLLFFFGLVFVLEALSDILQVGLFKLSGGRRIFRMAPLHHHFELCGWSETQVLLRFLVLALVGSALGWFLLFC